MENNHCTVSEIHCVSFKLFGTKSVLVDQLLNIEKKPPFAAKPSETIFVSVLRKLKEEQRFIAEVKSAIAVTRSEAAS